MRSKDALWTVLDLRKMLLICEETYKMQVTVAPGKLRGSRWQHLGNWFIVQYDTTSGATETWQKIPAQREPRYPTVQVGELSERE